MRDGTILCTLLRRDFIEFFNIQNEIFIWYYAVQYMCEYNRLNIYFTSVVEPHYFYAAPCVMWCVLSEGLNDFTEFSDLFPLIFWSCRRYVDFHVYIPKKNSTSGLILRMEESTVQRFHFVSGLILRMKESTVVSFCGWKNLQWSHSAENLQWSQCANERLYNSLIVRIKDCTVFSFFGWKILKWSIFREWFCHVLLYTLQMKVYAVLHSLRVKKSTVLHILWMKDIHYNKISVSLVQIPFCVRLAWILYCIILFLQLYWIFSFIRAELKQQSCRASCTPSLKG
jgi:hypothetical protein